jgi:hypothetical protein
MACIVRGIMPQVWKVNHDRASTPAQNNPISDYDGRRWGVDAGTLAEPYGDQFTYTEMNPVNWCSGFCVLTFENGKLLPPELCEVIDGIAYFRGQRV